MNTFSKYDTRKIKGIAIILMIIHHCFLNPKRYAGHSVSFFPFSETTVNYWALFFKICVAIFVFITGYGLTLSFKKLNSNYSFTPKQYTNIILSRYIKLISGFMFTLVCVWIYSVLANTGWFSRTYGSGKRQWLYALIDLFGLDDLFGTPMFVATFWYMSLAQLLLFVIPLLIFLYKKFGAFLMYTIVLIASVTITFSYSALPRFSVCAALGIICADKNLIVKIKEFQPFHIAPLFNKILKFILGLIIIYILAFLRQSQLLPSLIGLWDSVISMIIIVFSYEFIINIPIVRNILSILGKYSMYIFLIHNFIRSCWYNDFTYSFYYAPLIVIVLLAISLGVSIIIDFIRKIIHFDSLVNKIHTKLFKVLKI